MPGIPFGSLNKAVHDWLTSDTVFSVVLSLNEKHDLMGEETRAISGALVGIATGAIPPEQFVKYLEKKLPFLSDAELLELSEELRRRVLKQIQATLRGVYGIDIEKIPTSIQPKVAPRTMDIQKNAAPTHTPAAARVMPAVPERPKARVMEMATVVDLRRPAAAQKAPVSTPAATRPNAQITEMQSGSLSAPKTVSAGAPLPAAPKPPLTPKEKEVLESEKPFGLAESIPKPPVVEGVVKYQDEHPMKLPTTPNNVQSSAPKP
jgi:hypothetical protein